MRVIELKASNICGHYLEHIKYEADNNFCGGQVVPLEDHSEAVENLLSDISNLLCILQEIKDKTSEADIQALAEQALDPRMRKEPKP